MSNKKLDADKVGSTNLEGLANLNIAGGQTVSEKNLALIKKEIGDKPIIDIDLRQESHGLINGMVISWFGNNDDANIGLTREQVVKDEKDKLDKISKEKYAKFENLPKESVNTISEIKNPEKVQTEEELAKSQGVGYLRITVSDHLKPLNDQVDLFVSSVKDTPKDTWLYFHCRAGIGRTTTFMAMYDMMHNAKTVSFDDIVKRQFLIGGTNLVDCTKPRNKKQHEERAEFVKKFYQYCHDNNDGFKTTWSQWCKNNNIQ
ncbi:protein tyrosine phosphatase [Clostridium sp. P21]|uniref:Protein tyrosine phosphatase n=2 Tax=Clostridium muellerianum TaxID=2716538 RepID=A0A7Y0EIT6_9CLOT|nr:protein tyrosine phosphatase [Clostridium muellerianum]